MPEPMIPESECARRVEAMREASMKAECRGCAADLAVVDGASIGYPGVPMHDYPSEDGPFRSSCSAWRIRALSATPAPETVPMQAHDPRPREGFGPGHCGRCGADVMLRDGSRYACCPNCGTHDATPAPGPSAEGLVTAVAEAIYHADVQPIQPLSYRKPHPLSAMPQTTVAEYVQMARAALAALTRARGGQDVR